MKKGLILTSVAISSLALSASAASVVVLQDNFDAYTPGNLVGQGGWTVTQAAAGTPSQVFSESPGDNAVSVAASGPDDYKALSSSIAHTDGDSLTIGVTARLTSATSGGDYFLHLSNPVGTTSTFFSRIYAQNTTGGFFFGVSASSGTGTTTGYGTTPLAFGTDYDLLLTWNFVAGATNDTFSLSVNGTPYASATWTSATAEPAAISAVNIRQGNIAVAALDNLVVTSVTAVPEPSTALTLIGGVGMLLGVRRRTSLAA